MKKSIEELLEYITDTYPVTLYIQSHRGWDTPNWTAESEDDTARVGDRTKSRTVEGRTALEAVTNLYKALQ